jgi:hypothetical protein
VLVSNHAGTIVTPVLIWDNPVASANDVAVFGDFTDCATSRRGQVTAARGANARPNRRSGGPQGADGRLCQATMSVGGAAASWGPTFNVHGRAPLASP